MYEISLFDKILFYRNIILFECEDQSKLLIII